MTTATDSTWLVSADDHVTAPRNVWVDRLPSKYADVGPRVVRETTAVNPKNHLGELVFDSGEKTADFWCFEDVKMPLMKGENAVGFEIDERYSVPMTYDEIRLGCYDQKARLADMDRAGVEASLCFPNFFPRFAGQYFVDAKDKELALLCVQAYNDWMLEEWCAGSNGRLVPLGILPGWDVALCAAEADRVGPLGMRAFTFSEAPARIGLPSIASGKWDPFFAACEANQIVVAMHIGSAPPISPSEDTAPGTQSALLACNSATAMLDWVSAGVFERFKGLKVLLAESNIGWIPYFLERLDHVWEHNRAWNGIWNVLPNPPSTYFPNHVYATFFDDEYGLKHADEIGVDNILFEMDYPHGDTNWPDSLDFAQRMTATVGPENQRKILRENARQLLRLD
ncbi:MAG: amidohydrolase family protein [Ilumatobacteraceae bacterium]